MARSHKFDILLRQPVEKMGDRGAVVRVARGFARNFLFPRRLAFAATDENRRRVEGEHKRRLVQEAERRESLQGLKARVEDLNSISLEVRASEEGKLYGSVTARMVAENLQAKGYGVEEAMVVLPEGLKEIGTYDVPLNLGGGVDSSIRVWVVRERE
ncbi:MAG: 50S ribosomal protein L9 [Planctomycetes bacterium]|nr:50S ribosomal protein L9 [Planctomycetota bacterium]